MAFPTAVNNQITDAVTQTKATVLGDVPSTVLNIPDQVISSGASAEVASHGVVDTQAQPFMAAQAVPAPSVQPRIYVCE